MLFRSLLAGEPQAGGPAGFRGDEPAGDSSPRPGMLVRGESQACETAEAGQLPVQPVDPLAERLARIEAEVGALREMVQRLETQLQDFRRQFE